MLVTGCTRKDISIDKTSKASQYITILGTAQDGGFPHIGCQKNVVMISMKVCHQNKR